MNAVITASLITVIGAIFLAAATYWFTKARERDAEIRKEKLEHYKGFALAISGIVTGEGTEEGQRAFSRACNSLNLVASHAVLVALHHYQDEIRVTNLDRNQARHDALLSELFYQMRRDLKVSPRDVRSTFQAGIWAAGVSPARGSVTPTGGP
jgi:hypothetical protein